MVFQDYALFPHLSVAGNIAFGLHGAPRGERAARVRELARAGRPVGRARQVSARDFRRPAAARRARARARAAARAAAARRAVLQPRRRPARAPVARGARHHQGERRDRGAGHARPAGGVRHGRRDRRHARGPHPAVGQRVQPLPPPGEPLRRRLRRPGRVPAGEGAQRPRSSRSSSACCRATRQRAGSGWKCCCGPTTWCTTTPRRRRPRWCTRRSAAPRSSTRCAWRAAARCWRWCRATTTTRSASASASASTSTTSWRFSPRLARSRLSRL